MTEKEIREGFKHLGLPVQGDAGYRPRSPDETGRLLARRMEETIKRLGAPRGKRHGA